MQQNNNPIITAKSLVKQVKSGDEQLVILSGLDLQIFPSESVAIQGKSGSGKTTLLGLLAGLDLPTSGEIIINEKIITNLNEDGRALVRANNVGFIFQSFHLLPSLSAIENVMLPIELTDTKKPRKVAKEWLSQVGLEKRVHHYPNQLSGGEQQRVAIARAFATSPKILFADEPTGNLDQENGEHIIDMLFELNEKHNTTLIIVTHDKNLAQRCSTQYQLLNGVLQ